MKKIPLPEEERRMPTRKVAEKYGISMVTARRSKKRGYVVVNYHANETPLPPTLQATLLKLLDAPYWNYAGFGVKDTIPSVKAGRRKFSVTDGETIKKQIKSIKTTITRITDYSFPTSSVPTDSPLYKDLRLLMQDRRVKTIPIFGGDEVAVWVTDNIRKGFPIKQEQAKRVITNLKIELLEFYEVFAMKEG